MQFSISRTWRGFASLARIAVPLRSLTALCTVGVRTMRARILEPQTHCDQVKSWFPSARSHSRPRSRILRPTREASGERWGLPCTLELVAAHVSPRRVESPKAADWPEARLHRLASEPGRG